MQRNLEHFLAHLRKKQAEHQAGLKEFREAFDKDPLTGLRWSSGAFESAAFVHWTTDVLKALTAPESKATMDTVERWLADFVSSRAASPEHSSSPTANLIQRYELAVVQHILSVLRGERL